MGRERTHRVVMVAFPDAQVLDVVGPLEVFSRTARLLGASLHGGNLTEFSQFTDTRGGRFGLVPVLVQRFARDGVILLDDFGREPEKEIADRWAFIIENLGME